MNYIQTKLAIAKLNRNHDRIMAKPPCIDLGGQVAVIDDTVNPPVWRKAGPRVVASVANAKGIMRLNNLTAAWMIDDLGNKLYITL